MPSSAADAAPRPVSPLATARIAVVGATGAAGGTVLQLLMERGVPMDQVVLLASQRSAGSRLSLGGSERTVGLADEAALAGVDVAFLAAGASVARELAPAVAAGGGLAVDKSSAFREDPTVPLVVPAVNADGITAAHAILANPNCVAIPLSIILGALAAHVKLRRITVATYQAASGGGRGLRDELAQQCAAAALDGVPEHHHYPHVLHGNVVPGGWSMDGDDTEEEVKIASETRRVLVLPDLRLSITTVRVPVAVGHSAAVWVEADEAISPVDARQWLSAARAVRIIDSPQAQAYPTSLQAAGQDDVLVGRIREDRGHPGGLSLFFSSDNLRRGAATNAVEVAELGLTLRQH